MLPTITSLTRKAANDGGMEQSLEKVMVHATTRAVNDVEDIYEKTMDRIMSRHNGQDRKYRDDKGRFVSIRKVAANDKVDAYEKTMDRIMARHNGHDRPQPQAANEPTAYEKTMDRIMLRHNGHDRETPEADNDQRNIHDYWNTVPQAVNRPKVLPLDKKMRTLVLRNNADDDSGGSTGSRILPVLTSIEENVKRIANSLKDSRDGMGIASLRAREMALENQQGFMPFNGKNPLDGHKDGQTSSILNMVDSIKKFGTDLESAAVLGVAGVAAKAISSLMPKQEDPRDGGGHFQKQPFERTSEASESEGRPTVGVVKKSPRAAAKADIVSPSTHIDSAQPSGSKSKFSARKQELQLMAYNSFRKLGYTDEAAKTMVAEIGRENNFNEDKTGKHGDVFGNHIDPANKELNVGMISWQRDRRKNLLARLEKKGLVKNGQLVRSQTTMDEMARFLDDEMKKDSSMKASWNAARDPDKKYNELEAMFGGKVIKWVHDRKPKDWSPAQWERVKKLAHETQEMHYNSITDILNRNGEKITGDPRTEKLLKEMKGVKPGQLKKLSDGAMYQGGNSITINMPPVRAASAAGEAKAKQLREKKRVPPPRSSMWDGFKQYFSF